MPVHYNVKGRVGHIQLEGRGDYNVFSPEYIYNPLHDALTAYRQDPEVWVVIISAVAGRKAFTYGGDIQSLDALANDHEFLLRGDVFTRDLVETWIDYKRESEVDAIRLRPHPHEFSLYFDI